MSNPIEAVERLTDEELDAAERSLRIRLATASAGDPRDYQTLDRLLAMARQSQGSGEAVAMGCRTCNSPRAVDPCPKCGTALTKPADGWEWPGLTDIERIRELARQVGYAVAVHGSMERDQDLIAVPWVADAVSPAALAKHIADGLGGEVVDADIQDKPCGRWACNIHTPEWTKLIDLSVMPPVAREGHASKALKTAIEHIEHMAAFIGAQNAGYSFESIGEDMPGLKAALSASPPPAEMVELEVWYGAMPESNGKQNWTALLRLKDRNGLDGCTRCAIFARSEYPDRVRYEADRLRWIIGETDERPDILAYDADLHSGYVAPAEIGATVEEIAKAISEAVLPAETRKWNPALYSVRDVVSPEVINVIARAALSAAGGA